MYENEPNMRTCDECKTVFPPEFAHSVGWFMSTSARVCTSPECYQRMHIAFVAVLDDEEL